MCVCVCVVGEDVGVYTFTLSGDERVSLDSWVSFSLPPPVLDRKLLAGGTCEEEGVGEGVWRRGEGVCCVKVGEVDGERRERRISTRAGFERTVLSSCLSESERRS